MRYIRPTRWGGDISTEPAPAMVHGSVALTRWLLENDLVDEMNTGAALVGLSLGAVAVAGPVVSLPSGA